MQYICEYKIFSIYHTVEWNNTILSMAQLSLRAQVERLSTLISQWSLLSEQILYSHTLQQPPHWSNHPSTICHTTSRGCCYTVVLLLERYPVRCVNRMSSWLPSCQSSHRVSRWPPLHLHIEAKQCQSLCHKKQSIYKMKIVKQHQKIVSCKCSSIYMHYNVKRTYGSTWKKVVCSIGVSCMQRRYHHDPLCTIFLSICVCLRRSFFKW